MVQEHNGTPLAPPRARGLTCAPRAAQELLEGCARVPRSGDPRLALWRHRIDQDVRQLLDRNLRAEGVARKRRRDLALDGRRSRKAWRGIDGRLQAVGVSHALGARSLRSLAVKLLSCSKSSDSLRRPGGQSPPGPPQRLPAPSRPRAKGKGAAAPRPRCRAPQKSNSAAAAEIRISGSRKPRVLAKFFFLDAAAGRCIVAQRSARWRAWHARIIRRGRPLCIQSYDGLLSSQPDQAKDTS